MKKQEIIKKWTDIKDMMNSKEYQSAASAFLKDLQHLDEPEEVVVPDYIAEIIVRESCLNSSSAYVIKEIMTNIKRYPTSAQCWLNDIKNRDILAQAVVNGYAVKKEPLYYVQFVGDYILIQDDEELWADTLEDLRGFLDLCKFKFTKGEINGINPGYWPFAVPAEED